jgi:hypothetical protein
MTEIGPTEWVSKFNDLIRNPPFKCEYIVFESSRERILFLNTEALEYDLSCIQKNDVGFVGEIAISSIYKVK